MSAVIVKGSTSLLIKTIESLGKSFAGDVTIIGDLSVPGGSGSERFGENAVAAGTNSTAMGRDAVCYGDDNVCIGRNAHNSAVGGNSDVVIGADALISNGGGAAVAVGANATAGPSSVAIGESCAANGGSALAAGRLAVASASSSTCVGPYADATGASCTALGAFALSSNTASQAFGLQSTASHSNSVAMGRAADSTAGNRMTVGEVGGAYLMDLQVSRGLAVFGGTPPTVQPSKISDPSGGGTIDAEARSAINAIIDVLEGANLSSPT